MVFLLSYRSRATILLALLVAAGCGKKGSPLAPVLHVPAAVDRITTQRVGNDVFVTLTVPAKNIDASTPADIARIEVYGYTGRTVPRAARWLDLGTLITMVPVAPLDPTTAGAEPPVADPAAGALQGTSLTIRDTLTADTLVEGKVDPPLPLRRGATRPPPVPALVDVAPLPLRRFYMVVSFSARGRSGPPKVVDLPLEVTPDPPQQVHATFSAAETAVSWEPSGGVVGFLFEHALIPEPSPTEDFEVIPTPTPTTTRAVGAAAPVSGPLRYNVYRDPPPVLPAATPPPVNSRWSVLPDVALNETPLSRMAFTDDVEFGQRRCYVVRAVRGAPPNIVESEPSPPACVVAADVFPPDPPNALAAVAAEGAISLIWEPNGEPDLAGYLVLRGLVSDATLQRLTPAPVTEARYTDAGVTAGMQYVYAVVAVDKAIPVPNVSMESNRVVETAR